VLKRYENLNDKFNAPVSKLGYFTIINIGYFAFWSALLIIVLQQ